MRLKRKKSLVNKSLVGWTFKEWQEMFHIEKCFYNRIIFPVMFPKKEPNHKTKVCVTIEEL